METMVLSSHDCAKDGWPKSNVPGAFGWQEDGYSYYSHLRKTSSDLCEQMHAVGGLYLPAEMPPYGSCIVTEKHFSFATSVVESGRSSYDNIHYPTTHTWHCIGATSQMDCQARGVQRVVQGCRSGSLLRSQTLTRARNYEITSQVFCRYSSSSSVSGKSLERIFPQRDELSVCRTTPVARAGSLTHSLQRSKTSNHYTNRASTAGEERSSSASQKSISCKDSDVCAGGVLYTEDEVRLMSCEPMHNRPARKALQSIERVDCTVPWTASSVPYKTLAVRANCINKDAKESLASIGDVPLNRIKGGQEGKCSSMNTSKAKAVMRQSSPSCKRDMHEDQCDGLMSFDSVVTSGLITPPAINGCSQVVSQSGHSLAMNERWAGPAFSNSPSPSLLPVPTFTRRQSRTSSLEIPCRVSC